MKTFNGILWVTVLLFFVCSPLAAKDERSIISEDILSMSLEEIMDIKIITAGKKEERVADIPASAVIITRRDIETYGYLTLEEILENVPGMFVIDDLAPYRKTFGVRGFYAGYPRNIIFLVNGVSQADGVFDYNVMSNFNIPVSAIDKIEVVRGPMSVMYGQGAFFGAINIITNDSDDDTSLAEVSYGNMTRNAAAKAKGSNGDFSFSISAGASDSDGPGHSLGRMVSDIPSLASSGITAANSNTDGKLERKSGNFIFSGKYKGLYGDFSYNDSTDEAFVYRPSVTDGTQYERKMAKLSLGYEHQVTDKIKLNGNMSYHNFSFLLDWDVTAPWFIGNDAGTTSGNSDVYEFEVDAFWDVSDDIDLTAGLYYKLYHDTTFEADNALFNIFYDHYTEDDINVMAAFTQINYTPVEKLSLVGGLRAEKMDDYTIVFDDEPGTANHTVTKSIYDDDDVDLISSLAVIYSFNDKNVLKFLYGEAIARPSFFQNRDQFEDGNPKLESEEIQTVELNYITTALPRITVNFSIFHNVLDKLIVRTVQQSPTGTLYEYNTNGGELVTNGAELTVRAKPFEKLFAEFSLTYQNTGDERPGFENIDVAYSPHLLGYAKLSYQITDDITFALTGTYVDEMETEWDETLNNGAGGRIGHGVDDHFLLGANLRVNNLFNTGMYLNIRGSNVLDEAYQYPTYVNNTWADRGSPGAPMEYLVTLGYKF